MVKISEVSALARLRRAGRLVAFVTMLAVAPMALTGCYGRFPLTKAVYGLNGDITDDKIIHSVMFWVFLIVPVYGVAMLGDAIVLNLIEFWTGEAIDIGSATSEDGTTVAIAPGEREGEAVMTVSREGKVLGTSRFVKVSETEFEMLGPDGAVAGRVIRTAGGDNNLTDAAGKVVRTLPAGEVTAALGI